MDAREELTFGLLSGAFAVLNLACAVWTWFHWYTTFNIVIGCACALNSLTDFARWHSVRLR